MIDEIEDLPDLREADEADPVDRRVPEINPAEYDGFEDAPEDHKLITSGLASWVFDEDREEIGHVLCLDLDDVAPGAALFQARILDDPAVVLRSSPGCYHVVGLGVRAFEDALAEARDSVSCQEYVDEMDRQGRFVIRTQPKFRQASGAIYKDEPEPVAVTGGAGPVARPHAIRIRQLAEDVGRGSVADAIEEIVETNGTVGWSLTQSRYETITDELRAVLDAHEAADWGYPEGAQEVNDGE